MNYDSKVTILLAEDSEGHKILIEKNLRRAHYENPFVHVDNGQAALDYLLNDHPPVILLLDLNLPVLNGLEVLKRIKANDKTKDIPVIVFTSSSDQEEIKKCYDSGCNSCLTKPVDYHGFASVVRQIGCLLATIN
ncbi:MAG: response regulator [Chlamydiota bacterium]|nr:response regulator [Chlamydiota bacterium]